MNTITRNIIRAATALALAALVAPASPVANLATTEPAVTTSTHVAYVPTTPRRTAEVSLAAHRVARVVNLITGKRAEDDPSPYCDVRRHQCSVTASAPTLPRSTGR